MQLLGLWALWKLGSFGTVKGLLPRDDGLEEAEPLALVAVVTPPSCAFPADLDFDASDDVSFITVSRWPGVINEAITFLLEENMQKQIS